MSKVKLPPPTPRLYKGTHQDYCFSHLSTQSTLGWKFLDRLERTWCSENLCLEKERMVSERTVGCFRDEKSELPAEILVAMTYREVSGNIVSWGSLTEACICSQDMLVALKSSQWLRVPMDPQSVKMWDWYTVAWEFLSALNNVLQTSGGKCQHI